MNVRIRDTNIEQTVSECDYATVSSQNTYFHSAT